MNRWMVARQWIDDEDGWMDRQIDGFKDGWMMGRWTVAQAERLSNGSKDE